jgi:hypothetical protein
MYNIEFIDKLKKMSYCIIYMKSKLPCLFIILMIIMTISCQSGPKPKVEQAAPQPQVTPEPQVTRPAVSPPPAQTFDPRTVSQAQYTSTMEEVRLFIEELNMIIRNRNYNAWRAALSQEYFEEISSPENLRQISEQPAMRTQRIVLRTPQDYFTNVVVPSRADSRVDDIEFIGQNRVKVFTVNTTRTGEEQKLRLYDLEKINNSWRIIN